MSSSAILALARGLRAPSVKPIQRTASRSSRGIEKTGWEGLMGVLSRTLPRSALSAPPPATPSLQSSDLFGMESGLQGLGLVFANASSVDLTSLDEIKDQEFDLDLHVGASSPSDTEALTNTHVFQRIYDILDDECARVEAELGTLDQRPASMEGLLSEEDAKLRSSLLSEGTRLVEFGRLLDLAQARVQVGGSMEKAYTGRFKLSPETTQALESGTMAHKYAEVSYPLTSGREGRRWNSLKALEAIVSDEAGKDVLARLRGQTGDRRS